MIKFIAILSLLVTFNSVATDFVGECDKKDQAEYFPELELFKVGWWSASEKQVKKAPCSKTTVLNTGEINTYLDNKFPPGKGIKSEVVSGVSFTNEHPKLIEYFKDVLYNTDSYNSQFYNKDASTFKKLSVPSGCDKVRCALEHLYGEYGKYRIPRILYGLDKFQVNTSHIPFEISSKWKTSELDGLIGTMQDLPQHFFPLLPDKKKTMYHFSRDMKYKMNNSSTIANAVMMYFAGYDRFSDMKKKYVVTHELGHNVSTKLGDLDDSKKWLSISGWESEKEKWSAKESTSFVSDYAKTNPAEDFAESFTAYRFNPHLLKLASPEKYNFMKKYVYQGIEYLDNKKCKDRSDAVTKALKGIELTDEISESTLSGCEKSYGQMFVQLDSSKAASNEIMNCLKVSLLNQAVEKKLSSLSDDKLYNTAIKNSINESDNFEISSVQQENYKKQLLNNYLEGAVPAFQSAINGKFTGLLSTGSTSEVCTKDTSKYEYQKFDFLDNAVGSTFFSYSNRDKISESIVSLCKKILKKKRFKTIVTESDVRAELEDIFLTPKQKNDKKFDEVSILDKFFVAP